MKQLDTTPGVTSLRARSRVEHAGVSMTEALRSLQKPTSGFVVGAGGKFGGIHKRLFAQMGIDLTPVTTNPDRAEQRGIDCLPDFLKQMTRGEVSPDFAVLAVPPAHTAEVAQQILQAAANVQDKILRAMLVEKPLALSQDVVSEILQSAEAAKITISETGQTPKSPVWQNLPSTLLLGTTNGARKVAINRCFAENSNKAWDCDVTHNLGVHCFKELYALLGAANFRQIRIKSVESADYNTIKNLVLDFAGTEIVLNISQKWSGTPQNNTQAWDKNGQNMATFTEGRNDAGQNEKRLERPNQFSIRSTHENTIAIQNNDFLQKFIHFEGGRVADLQQAEHQKINDIYGFVQALKDHPGFENAFTR